MLTGHGLGFYQKKFGVVIITTSKFSTIFFRIKFMFKSHLMAMHYHIFFFELDFAAGFREKNL